jgi:methionine-rich copper-binding protein CopC
MNFKASAGAAILLLLSGLCHAHAHLFASVPAEGAVLDTPPKQVELSFSEPARLTAATLRRGTDKPQPLSLPGSPPAQHITLDLPALAPGSYTLDYRLISADSHIVAGTLHFKVSAAASSASH